MGFLGLGLLGKNLLALPCQNLIFICREDAGLWHLCQSLRRWLQCALCGLGPFPEGLDENTQQPLTKLHERRRCSPGVD